MSEGGHGDAGRLERRARWLLRAYPAAYRADRGEEIIGTHLEAVPPGRDWPPSREAVALVAAGLRARRAANLRQGLAASLRQVTVAGPPVVVFLLFARRTERPPLSLLWLPGLALGVALAESLASTYPALFAATTAGTTLLSPYTTGLSLVTVLVAVCWLATDVRPLASLVFAFTVSRVVYGFAYGRPLVTVGPAVITLEITASLVAACALAWLLRRRPWAHVHVGATPTDGRGSGHPAPSGFTGKT